MKRAIAKKLIERYFYQLSDGCGKPNCANKNCASSGSVEALSPNQAAARAIQLYSEEAELCELHPAKVPKTHDCQANTDDDNSGYVIGVVFINRTSILRLPFPLIFLFLSLNHVTRPIRTRKYPR